MYTYKIYYLAFEDNLSGRNGARKYLGTVNMDIDIPEEALEKASKRWYYKVWDLVAEQSTEIHELTKRRDEMHTTELSSRDREMLLQTFRQYRAHGNDGDDYSTFDQLEQKLQHGGELDELDLHMLRISICNEISDKDTINVLLGILPRGI